MPARLGLVDVCLISIFPLCWSLRPSVDKRKVFITPFPKCQRPQSVGRSSCLGWIWSGGGFMTGVAEIVCRPSIGGYWAGTRPAPTMDCGKDRRGGWNTGGCLNSSNCPRRSGMRRGALRGESPRTREGRRPDRTELQWSVISSQWSVGTALALIGEANWL